MALSYKNLVSSLVGAVLVVAALTAAAGSGVAGAAAAGTSDVRTVPAHWERNIVDKMDRSVARGLGEPAMGGTWTASDDSLFSVDDSTGGGRVVIGTGAKARAYVSGATSADQVVRTTFWIPVVPPKNNGTYVSLDLRRQLDGTCYRARIQMTGDNRILLAVTRLAGGAETVLGDVVTVTGTGGSGRAAALSAKITGTSPVHLEVTATPVGFAPTTVTRDDTSAARITPAGRYGLSVFNPLNTAPVNVVFRAMSGERYVPEAQVPVAADPVGTVPSVPTPAPPSSSGPRGAAAAGTTAYPIPDVNTVYVSPTGDDTNPGTADQPYRTLGRASAKAKPDVTTTIVMRGGTYHETVVTQANKPLVIQNYPGEAVWFDGSVPVADWTQQGAQWVHDGWTAKFDSTAGYDAAQAAAYQWLRPDHPMAAHPDQVFVDGVQLTQVGSAAAVVPGTFFSDYAGNRIVLGSDPAGHDIRATELQKALTLLAPGSVVRGINFRRFATSVPQQGAVILDGDNQRLENATVADIASCGLQVSGKHVTIDHDTFLNNGLQGLKGNLADYVTVSNSIISGNNSEYFNVAPVAAGIKLTRTDYAAVQNNLIADNHTIGVWFDTSSYGFTIAGNDVLDNEHHGIMLEISALGTVAGNTSSGNGEDGVHITDTGNVKVWNNTLAGNGRRGLAIDQDNRRPTASSVGRDTRRPFPDPTLDWVVRNIEIRNNVLMAAPDAHVDLRTTGSQTPMQQGITFNHNLLGTNTAPGASTINVTMGSSMVRYSASAWVAWSGDSIGNVQSAGSTADTMAADMAVLTSTVPLPADVASILGEPVGTQVWGRC